MSPSRLAFTLPGGVGVLFTDRSCGNLSSVAGAGAEHGESARERLRERLGLQGLLRGYQVHGACVRRAGPHDALRPPRPEEGCDGQATAAPLLGAFVLAADCMPVAIAGAGAVAMVHAGWRGLAAGVLEEGVTAVRELGGGCAPVAVVGPCAGPCCYEVGGEVRRALGQGGDRGHIDLRELAQRRLLAAGAAAVRHARACTICDERFFSHRREGAAAGRQAGVAWLA